MAAAQPTGAYFPSLFFRRSPTRAWEWGHQEENRKAESKRIAEREFSTGVNDSRHRRPQAELQEEEQVDGGAHGVRAPMEVTHSVEPFDGQGQAGE